MAEAGAQAPKLSLAGVASGYGAIDIIDGVSLSIAPGQSSPGACASTPLTSSAAAATVAQP